MTEWHCTDDKWDGVGGIWAQEGIEYWLEVECISIGSSGAVLNIKPSWTAAYQETVSRGKTIGLIDPAYGGWQIVCSGMTTAPAQVRLRVCVEAEPPELCSRHLTQEACEEDYDCYWYNGSCHGTPDPNPCSGYTNEADCTAHGCYWYDGACHGGSDPSPCSSKTNEVDCMAAGCAWENGVCKESGNGGTCADFTTQIQCEAHPGCKWVNGSCRGEDVDGTEEGKNFSSGGQTFNVKEILCERSAALVTHVNTGTTLEVIVNHITVFLIPGGIQVYMLGVAIDATCRYFAEESLALPKDIPDEPIPDNNDGSKGPFDETTYLEKKRTALIGEMGQEFSDDITDAAIIKKDKEIWDAKGGEDWFKEIMRQLAAGEITEEEAMIIINETIIETTVTEIITVELIKNFALTVPSIVMAGDVVISGTAPKANETFQIMAVQRWFGYDAFAADKMLAEVMSGDDYKFKTTIALEDFGGLTIYAKAPKEWFEFWVDDIESSRHTVYVLTWAVLLALALGIGLMLEKKYNKLGLFKKKR